MLSAWARLVAHRSACRAHAVLAVRRLQQLRLRQCLLGWARVHWRGLATRRLHHDKAAHSLLQVLCYANAQHLPAVFRRGRCSHTLSQAAGLELRVALHH